MSDSTLYYRSAYTAQQIENAINFMLTQVAEPYDTTKTYALTDYVVYNGLLYQCIEAIVIPESWTAAKWEVQKIFDNDGYIIIRNGECDTEPVAESEDELLNVFYNFNTLQDGGSVIL